MPRASKRQVRGQKGAESRWRSKPIDLDAARLAFSILVEGAQPEKTLKLLAWNDLRCKKRDKMYKAMKVIGQEIIALAEESMDYERKNLPEGAVIGFDGSWNHRRRGTNCLFSVICRQTGRVIESITVSNKIEKTSPNFCEHSNLMESHGLRMAVEKLKDFPQIVGYVHDNDGKARKVIEQSGWGIKEYLDPGHALNCFEKKLKKFNKLHPQLLRGIEGSLRKWIRALLKFDGTTEEKMQLWENSVRHYMGDHTLCNHEDREFAVWDKAADPEAINLLKSFLESTKFILEYCKTEFDTQANESLHKLKLKYATKDVKWGDSWKARMMCAVLDRNCAHWKLLLYERLGLPRLSEETKIFIQTEEDKRIQWKLYVHTDVYREKRYLERKAARQQCKRICNWLQQFAYGVQRRRRQ